MEYKELIDEFGRMCGLDGLEFDEDGIAAIMADDIRLSFMEVAATRQLVMFADVAEKPHGSLERLYETLLKAQHLGEATDGATFSLSPDGTISLYRLEPLAGLDVKLLAKIVEDFLNLIAQWRELIAKYRPDAAPAADDLPAEGLSSATFHFLRV